MQGVGDVITKPHRCVAFTNLYEHKVQPFHLEDPTKTGHRKIFVFFLIDPTQRVFSATDVAPQQSERITEAMRGAYRSSAFSKLPMNILTMISNKNKGVITRAEAEKYRKKLISEKMIFVEDNDGSYFGTFSFNRRIKERFPLLWGG